MGGENERGKRKYGIERTGREKDIRWSETFEGCIQKREGASSVGLVIRNDIKAPFCYGRQPVIPSEE